ncbi:MAG: hypothetical protein KJN72_12250 [Woeseia sp.]|nr:hypothetical protein [Woeseia sp.]
MTRRATTVREKARALGVGQKPAPERNDDAKEVQPAFHGRLGPSKAGLFKPTQASHNAPVGGIAPLAEAPTAPGWYIVKQPTARVPYWEYFSAEQIGQAQADHDDSKLAFYPWTPLTNPNGEDSQCTTMAQDKMNGSNTISG